MSHDFSYIPAGYHSVTPSLTVKDAKAAIEFYAKAFGAVENFILPDPKSGGISHAEFNIGNCAIMISDEYPEAGALAPQVGKGGLFIIYVKDVEAAFKQAVEAGAAVLFEPTDQFWGDRTARVADPFGYRWTLAQKVRDMSPEELAGVTAAMFGE